MATVTLTNRRQGKLSLPAPFNVTLSSGQTRSFDGINLALLHSTEISTMLDRGYLTVVISNDADVPDELELESRGDVGGPRAYLANHVKYGLVVAVGSTPSGSADYNLDVTAGEAAVGGSLKFAGPTIAQIAQTDFDYKGAGYTLAGGAAGFNAASKDSYWALCLVLDDDGIIKFKAVRGADATTGAAVNPSDAQVEAALTTGLSVAATYSLANRWYRICDILVSRDSGTTITETFDNTVRPTPTL